MKVLLIGNYLPDEQRTMQRFAKMLEDGLRARGHEVRLARSTPSSAANNSRAPARASGLPISTNIWCSLARCRAAPWADVVHICDHSNAMYVAALRNKPHVVTCHDLFAVRGSSGNKRIARERSPGKFFNAGFCAA